MGKSQPNADYCLEPLTPSKNASDAKFDGGNGA